MSEDECSTHRYPRAVLMADMLRGASGLFVCVALLAVARPADWLVLLLTACAALFAGYLFRVWTRCRCRIELDSRSLRVFATLRSETASTRLDWGELERLDLDYFCTRRDGREGWLQLRLRAGKRTVRLDSRLSGFECVLARAVDAARLCGVELSVATASNLVAIGFEDSFVVDSGGDAGNEDRSTGLDGKRGGDMSEQMDGGARDASQ